MQRAATTLTARDPHLASVRLQHAGRVQVGLGVKRVGDAAEEERDTRAGLSLWLQHLWQLAVVRLQVRKHVLHTSEGLRKEFRDADSLSQPVEAGPLHEPRRRERDAIAPAMREDPEEHEALEGVERLHLAAGFLFAHEGAEGLDQPAVLDAGGAGRLASPAIETEIEVPLHIVIESEVAIDHLPHEVDTTAWRIALVGSLDV